MLREILSVSGVFRLLNDSSLVPALFPDHVGGGGDATACTVIIAVWGPCDG